MFKSQLLRHSLSKLLALSGERQGLGQWHAAETRVLRRRPGAGRHRGVALFGGWGSHSRNDEPQVTGPPESRPAAALTFRFRLPT